MSNTDLLDPELCGMFKPGHVEDLTVKPPVPKKKSTPVDASLAPVKKPTPVDAPWAPAKSNPSEMDRGKACALSILPYAAMSGVVLWWQQTEQLVSETGFWALIVIGVLGAYKVGKCGRDA